MIISTYQVMYYISHLVKEKKSLGLYIKEAESKMDAYIVFETGHTFGPSMLYPVYRSVGFPNAESGIGENPYSCIYGLDLALKLEWFLPLKCISGG